MYTLWYLRDPTNNNISPAFNDLYNMPDLIDSNENM